MNFQMLKLDLEKAEEPEIKLPASAGSSKKGEIKTTNKQTNIYFCSIDYAKAFDCVDHNKLWKIHVYVYTCIMNHAVYQKLNTML